MSTLFAVLSATAVILILLAPVQAENRLRMATTTSTENSRLLDVLLPPFEKANSVKVDVISVGTGKAGFISRGDDSGANKKEKAIWKAAGITPKGAWYMQAGQGMGAVLQMAFQKKAYTLTDRGTYLAMKDKIDLPILFEGDPALFNPYGIIAANPKKHPGVDYEMAKKFIHYLTSPEEQKIIAGFKKGGKQLFYPDAIKSK